MRDRYSLIVGLLFAAVIAIAVINTLEHKDEGTLGLDKLEPPLAAAGVRGAARRRAAGRRRQRRPGRLQNLADALPALGPARARLPDRHSGLAARLRLLRPAAGASFWFTRGGSDCTEQQDVVSRVYGRYGGRVNFLSLDIRDDRDTVRDLIRRREWKMPVGYDRDGAVAGLYRVGLCPTFAYVYPGGTLQAASIGELTAKQLEAHVEELLRATRTAEAG